ncbi:hypothetical protein DOTSEDRAFT_45311 [Dothistroma septosporum NZE10]|uniref:Metallo-beta-lactamase domain-containing protein n=1 Tax=Dothistroma septosporum (strain NZE10 / CBS 128990) TaxID=675120 RepID=M2YN18_DOTSN|nr:hypothetical protein DOTSEDRAFT_45311 [Dothistroma septosporum NZE10]
MTTVSAVRVTELPSRSPDPTTARSHHVPPPGTGFRNPWPSFQENDGFAALKLKFGNHPEKNHVPVPTGPDGARSDELVKVLKPTWATEQNDKLRATWLGHAGFLVETPAADGCERGVRILFDAVFSERTSPVGWAGPKRYTPPPCTIDELPEIDVICISHNHYDHLDIHTVMPLYQKLKGKVHFVVGLNSQDWYLRNIGCTTDEVTELDWWESRRVDINGLGSIDLTCTPAQHFSGRTLWDRGHALWCSYVINTPATSTSPAKSLYFAGDTAYKSVKAGIACPIFEQIGQVLGPFDLAMLPIGLSSPPEFMSAVHAHPEQTLEIHKAIKSKLSLGMHYGTVRGGLSGAFEPVTDPPRRWREAAQKEDMWAGGGVEGDGSDLDPEKGSCGLCHVGATIAV